MAAYPGNVITYLAAVAKPVALSYCDYIAHRIKEDLSRRDPEGLIRSTGPIKWDLHPEGGYMLTTKKTIEVFDRNGQRYRITVEDADAC